MVGVRLWVELMQRREPISKANLLALTLSLCHWMLPRSAAEAGRRDWPIF